MEASNVKGKSTSHATIRVQLQMQDKEDFFFSCEKDVPLLRFLHDYSDRIGLKYEVIMFTCDGKRIRGTETADKLGMEDEDTIDAWLECIYWWLISCKSFN